MNSHSRMSFPFLPRPLPTSLVNPESAICPAEGITPIMRQIHVQALSNYISLCPRHLLTEGGDGWNKWWLRSAVNCCSSQGHSLRLGCKVSSPLLSSPLHFAQVIRAAAAADDDDDAYKISCMMMMRMTIAIAIPPSTMHAQAQALQGCKHVCDESVHIAKHGNVRLGPSVISRVGLQVTTLARDLITRRI